MDVKELGKGLFGRSLRLQVALWALQQEGSSFYVTQVAQGVDYCASGVSVELSRLAGLGLLTPIADSGSRRLYYIRTDSPLWGVFEVVAAALAEEASTDRARQRVTETTLSVI